MENDKVLGEIKLIKLDCENASKRSKVQISSKQGDSETFQKLALFPQLSGADGFSYGSTLVYAVTSSDKGK